MRALAVLLALFLASCTDVGRSAARSPSAPAPTAPPASTPVATPNTRASATPGMTTVPGGAPVVPLPPNVVPLSAAQLAQMRSSRWHGNNAEAESFARSYQELQAMNKIGSWVHLDLLPTYTGQLAGNAIIDYRKSVQTVTLTVLLDDLGMAEWSRTSLGLRAGFLESSVRSLHLPPAIVLGPLDYYPNASVRVVINDPRGAVLGLGTHTAATGTVLLIRP